MKKEILICLPFLLTGCFGGYSKPAEFFLLPTYKPAVVQNETLVSNEIVSQKPFQIAVTPVLVPTFLNKPYIVLQEKDSSQLSLNEVKRWAEPLSQVAQRAIIDNMQHYLPNAYIKTRQYNDESYRYLVTVEINQMIGTLNEEAVLDVWWSVAGKNKTQKHHIVLTEKAGDTYQSYVDAQGALWQKLSREIAQQIAR